MQTPDNNESIENLIENTKLTHELKTCCTYRTLYHLAQYLIKEEYGGGPVKDSLEEFKKKLQSLFWEFKEERLIDDFNRFDEVTEQWITKINV